jgi:hypothetical protein
MTDKKKTSRFDELINAALTRKQRDNILHTNEKPTRNTKSTDPNYTRTTVYLPKQLHRQLKATAADEDKQMSDIIIQLLEEWLAKKGNSGNS